jgi:tetracycline 7-halogenase / FADH2 O2-dependent halogenase
VTGPTTVGARRAENRFHVAILGAGLAGSMLGAVLARHGVRVLLVDTAAHPRFAIGESTTPYTSVLTRIIADRYQVPEIRALASFAGIVEKVSRNCGRKQNFGFVYHREGEAHRPEEVNQLVIPRLLQTETHLFRQDTDAYMFNVAVKYGAVAQTGTRIVDIEIDADRGVTLRSRGGTEFQAQYLVDAGGVGSPLAAMFRLREEPTRARHHSRTLFTHMVGVAPFEHTHAGSQHKVPDPWSNGTLHHVFPGGWLWVIPFDNHPGSLNPLCSVGLTLDPRMHPPSELSPQQEFDEFLRRFPDIAAQFEDAGPARPWQSVDRLQYSSKQIVGDRYCLTSHAAGFVDPLYARGLTNTLEVVNALGWRLIRAAQEADWSTERFLYLEDLQQGLFDIHDDLAYGAFIAFRDYELWNAVHRTWGIDTVLATFVLEDAYARFLRHGDEDDGVFRELEQTEYPGSPLVFSEEFNDLIPSTRQLCAAVDGGALSPHEAASRLFSRFAEADFIAPAFGFADPGQRYFHPTARRMLSAHHWARTAAPREIGEIVRGALGGFVTERVRHRG